MKIAVCFSGQIRAGVHAFDNIRNYIGFLWDSCDFFIHTWNTETKKPYNAAFLSSNPLYSDVDAKLTALDKLYKFSDISVEDLDINTTEPPLWNSFRKSLELKRKYEIKFGKYDYVIKLRPDLLFTPHRKLITEMKCLSDNEFYIENYSGRDERSDDVFFMSKSEYMDIILNYKHIDDTNISQILLENSVIPVGGDNFPYRISYTILREECAHLHPIASYRLCLDCNEYFFGVGAGVGDFLYKDLNKIYNMNFEISDGSEFYVDKLLGKPLKIAICFSGQIRTGIHAYDSIRNFIGDLWDSCDFFCHTWDVETKKPYSGVVTDGTIFYGGDFFKILKNSKIESFKNLYPFKSFILDSYTTTWRDENFLESDDITVFNHIPPQWYSFQRSIELKREYELNNNLKYDMVVRMRPDILYHPNRKLSDIINVLYPFDIFIENCDFGNHHDDVFFVSTTHIMDAISNYYSEFKNNPSLTYIDYFRNHGSLVSNSVLKDKTWSPTYAVYREESLGKDPIEDYDEFSTDDFYYYMSNNAAGGFYHDTMDSELFNSVVKHNIKKIII